MITAKDTLRIFLEKVETGKVTSEDIQTAQAILDSSVIISSRSVMFKGAPHGRVKRNFLAYRSAAQTDLLSDDDFYTVQEVAERFKVSDKAVYKWIDQNKIQYVRSTESSRDIRIPKEQFITPPSKAAVRRREHDLFKGAVEMELVRRKDLYRDEE